MDELLDFIKQYNALVDAKRFDELSEVAGLIGEAAATEKATGSFLGAEIRRIVTIPRRANGVVILDLAIELEDNTGVVIEAKFNTAVAGTTRELVFAADEASRTAQKLVYGNTIEQNSAGWLRDRFKEIRNPETFDYRYLSREQALARKAKRSKKLASAESGIATLSKAERRQIANRFGFYLETGRLRVLEMQTIPTFENGKITDVSMHTTDHSAEVFDEARNGRRGVANPAVRKTASKAARRVPAIRAEQAALRATIKTELKAVRAAKRELKLAENALARHKKIIAGLQQEKAIERRSMLILEAEAEVERKAQAVTAAEGKANALISRVEVLEKEKQGLQGAHDAAVNAQRLEAVERRAINNQRIRDAETATTGEPPERGSGGEPGSKAGADPASEARAEKAAAESAHVEQGGAEALREERALAQAGQESGQVLREQRAVSQTGKEAAYLLREERGVANTEIARGVTSGSHSGRTASHLSEIDTATKTAAKVERVVEADLKAARLVRTLSIARNIGKLALTLIVPVSFADALFQIGLWIIEREIEKNREDREEWERIISFLIGPQSKKHVLLVGFYRTSMAPVTSKAIADLLYGPDNNQNFLYWFRKWDRDHSFLGFVYPVISTTLQRQLLPEAPGRDEVEVRYFPRGPVVCSFGTNSQFYLNSRKASANTWLDPDDPRNKFTGGLANNPGEHWDPEETDYAKHMQEMGLYVTGRVADSDVVIRYTVPGPALTPFDFALFRCKTLLVDLLQLISVYDDTFLSAYPFEASNFWANTFLENADFADPVQTLQARWCVQALLYFISELSSDTRIVAKDWEPARDKRQALLTKLTQTTEARAQLVGLRKNLLLVLTERERAYLDNLAQPNLITPLKLVVALEAFWDDLLRMWRDVSSDNVYRSFPYEYRGVPHSEYGAS